MKITEFFVFDLHLIIDFSNQIFIHFIQIDMLSNMQLLT